MTLEQFKETDFYKQNTFLPDIDSTICNLDEWDVSWEKRGIIYYSKKIIKALLLWNLWHK